MANQIDTAGGAAGDSGRGQARGAALTESDQRLVFTTATLLLDVTRAFAVDVARFVMEKLPNLPRDEEMVEALEDHADADAREVLITVRAGMDPSAHETPIEAIAHARYLRERGVNVQTMISTYQLGFAMFREIVQEEVRQHTSDPAQLERVFAGLDTYAFPFVEKATQRVAYEFRSRQAWSPEASDEVLANPEAIERAHRLRASQMERRQWTASSLEHAGASRDAERLIDEFSDALESGVRDRGLDDPLALAKTTVTITLADEESLSVSLLLDRSPIEIERGIVDAECRLWIPSVDLPRLWSPEYQLTMSIAKNRVRVRGPVRKFLRIIPILRTAVDVPELAEADFEDY